MMKTVGTDEDVLELYKRGKMSEDNDSYMSSKYARTHRSKRPKTSEDNDPYMLSKYARIQRSQMPGVKNLGLIPTG